MKNIANAERPKPAIAIVPRRPFRRSGNVAQTALRPARSEDKSRAPFLNPNFPDSGIPFFDSFRTAGAMGYCFVICRSCAIFRNPKSELRVSEPPRIEKFGGPFFFFFSLASLWNLTKRPKESLEKFGESKRLFGNIWQILAPRWLAGKAPHF
jgi:hypothetical protein